MFDVALSVYTVLHLVSLTYGCDSDLVDRILSTKNLLDVNYLSNRMLWVIAITEGMEHGTIMADVDCDSMDEKQMVFAKIYSYKTFPKVEINDVRFTQSDGKAIVGYGYPTKNEYYYYLFEGPRNISIAYICDPNQHDDSPMFTITIPYDLRKRSSKDEPCAIDIVKKLYPAARFTLLKHNETPL